MKETPCNRCIHFVRRANHSIQAVWQLCPPKTYRDASGVSPRAAVLSMNPRMCRQVLDCGDGVCEVTALATLTAPKLADAETIPTQSGNSADSVAALQKLAHQPMPRQFMVSMRVQCRRCSLPMNLGGVRVPSNPDIFWRSSMSGLDGFRLGDYSSERVSPHRSRAQCAHKVRGVLILAGTFARFERFSRGDRLKPGLHTSNGPCPGPN